MKFIKNNEIDYKRWNSTIYNSVNGIVYAYSFYLDIMCPEWSAIVTDDYSSVMPVPINKKLGVVYSFQPPFIQQLGIFTATKLDNEQINNFLDILKENVKLININLNSFNSINHNDFKIKELPNYELDLIEKYSDIYKKYSTSHKRNIKKAIKNKIVILSGQQANKILHHFKTEGRRKISNKKKNLSKLLQLMTISLYFGYGEIYTAYTDKNEIVASVFFVKSHNKIIYRFVSNSNRSKELSALFLLLDKFIKNNSNKNIILDFEGSNIENIARFYRGFGAKKCSYQNIIYNNLSFPLKEIYNFRIR